MCSYKSVLIKMLSNMKFTLKDGAHTHTHKECTRETRPLLLLSDGKDGSLEVKGSFLCSFMYSLSPTDQS